MALIAILFRNERNRDLFAGWIREYTDHDPVLIEDPRTLPETTFDLCLVDGFCLREYTEALEGATAKASPRFLPVLLMIDRREGQRLSDLVWDQADDIIWRDPNDLSMEQSRQFRFEIEGRIENLLARRALSVDLDRRRQLTLVLQRILRHNLRNELNIIQGFGEQLRSETEGDSADQIVSTTQRLTRLADKARTLEEIVNSDETASETDPAVLLERLVDRVRDRYEDVSVDLDYSGVERSILLRPSFERAVLELLENAAKHGAGSREVRITATQTASETNIRVDDDGPGLSDDERRVLESGVERTLSHGQGIGHWLVYWVVTDHGGEIETEVSDDGTTVIVSVPNRPPEVD
ncbi:hypothetical protein GRX03_06890 [Halovenus sp. WSH3]|uniref:histidine kinase n=1 Tax=Halovenus carboxidivorans TaxID=2692199 RepID=A0A6B0T814_9EURY|nr:HAMP domain-containing sensor histidine kinase [Halovenus carboxidivorans]MXR51331.1 hypothetical protein [Halovenus carboxidivorans]